jgi:hypothetical protein
MLVRGSRVSNRYAEFGPSELGSEGMAYSMMQHNPYERTIEHSGKRPRLVLSGANNPKDGS